MPQQPTDHPPLQTSGLPFTEQVLIRLDEIIGLLDQIAQLPPGRRAVDGTGNGGIVAGGYAGRSGSGQPAAGRGGRGETTLMPSLRSDTTFLVLLVAILLAALAVTGMETPDAPRRAQITPRPLPTPTGTPTPGWWGEVAFATPTLPALPGMPNVQLERRVKRQRRWSRPLPGRRLPRPRPHPCHHPQRRLVAD